MGLWTERITLNSTGTAEDTLKCKTLFTQSCRANRWLETNQSPRQVYAGWRTPIDIFVIAADDFLLTLPTHASENLLQTSHGTQRHDLRNMKSDRAELVPRLQGAVSITREDESTHRYFDNPFPVYLSNDTAPLIYSMCSMCTNSPGVGLGLGPGTVYMSLGNVDYRDKLNRNPSDKSQLYSNF